MRPIFEDNIYLGECEIRTFLEIPIFGIIFMKKSFRNFTIPNPHHKLHQHQNFPIFHSFKNNFKFRVN
jgi:hypothetical protein